jgi:1,4-dihydroxy-2-naphthoate octaprenyltransferase
MLLSVSSIRKKMRDLNFVRGFWQLADPKIWTASMVPFVLGTCIAAGSGFQIQWRYAFLAILVIILVEIGKNGVNEYYDYKSGADLNVNPADRTQFSGGKKVIVDKILTLKEVGWISFFCLFTSIMLAFPILIYSDRIIWFGIGGIFLSIAYSMPPLQLSYRGLGEIAVGLTFGPIIVTGAYFLQANRIDIAPILISIPLAFLIANVLWINEIPDVEADRKAGKMNLVARRGRSEAIYGYRILFILAYLSLIMCAIILRNLIYLTAMLTSVMAFKAVRNARANVMNTQELSSANGLTILIYLATGIILSIVSLIHI